MTLDACMTSSKFSICVGRCTKILQINYWKTASILEDGKRREQSFEKKIGRVFVVLMTSEVVTNFSSTSIFGIFFTRQSKPLLQNLLSFSVAVFSQF